MRRKKNISKRGAFVLRLGKGTVTPKRIKRYFSSLPYIFQMTRYMKMGMLATDRLSKGSWTPCESLKEKMAFNQISIPHESISREEFNRLYLGTW